MKKKKKLYKCGPHNYMLPKTACVFCNHCTDVFWDYHGIYALICDIDAMDKCQKEGYGCSEFRKYGGKKHGKEKNDQI